MAVPLPSVIYSCLDPRQAPAVDGGREAGGSPDPGPAGPGHVGSPSCKLAEELALRGRNVPRRGPQHIRRPGDPPQPGREGQDGEPVYFGTGRPQESHTEHFTTNLRDPWQPTASLASALRLGSRGRLWKELEGVEEECGALRGVFEPPSPVDRCGPRGVRRRRARGARPGTAPPSRNSLAAGGAQYPPQRGHRATLTRSVGQVRGAAEGLLSRGDSSCKGPEAGGSVVREKRG